MVAYGLAVEPSKTGGLRFGNQALHHSPQDGLKRPKTFTFLGFTHYVGRSRTGRFVVGRKTEGKRLRRKLKQLSERLRDLRAQGGKTMMAFLHAYLHGHIQYYGVSGNSRSLRCYLHEAGRLLFKWRMRRSQRRSVPWGRMSPILNALLPKPRIVHQLYPVPKWKAQAGSRMV